MALLATGALTLSDWAKRLDPNGQVPVVAELLTQTNEILEDAVFMEGNLPTGHRLTIRTGLPQVFYRMINQGVPTSKSVTAQIDEACGKKSTGRFTSTKHGVDVRNGAIELNFRQLSRKHIAAAHPHAQTFNQQFALCTTYPQNPPLNSMQAREKELLKFRTALWHLRPGLGTNKNRFCVELVGVPVSGEVAVGRFPQKLTICPLQVFTPWCALRIY